MNELLNAYFGTLHDAIVSVQISGLTGDPVSHEAFFALVTQEMRSAHQRGNKIIFVGNGGSSGIASHMAIDFAKNGKLRATALNDAAALTCLGNDLGYDKVFSEQISMQARTGDILVAISSSGRSPNILNAVRAARASGCRVVTLSGFSPDNPLRSLGDYNLFVASGEYGFVEVAHLALIHAILDIELGWGRSTAVEGDRANRHSVVAGSAN